VKAEPVARPVVGFRSWQVTEAEHGVLRPLFGALPSVVSRAWGEPRRPTRAYCAHAGVHGLCDEALSCDCGLHATARYRWMPGTCVTGAIVAWGRIVEHRQGFRAEYARPVAFAEPTHGYWCVATEVAALYGVPFGCDCAADSRLSARMAERYAVPVLPPDDLVAYAQWFGELLSDGERASLGEPRSE
jgi:hypothetical protein